MNQKRAEIPRVSVRSHEEFRTRVLAKKMPAVITGATESWPAMTKWSPQFFKTNFGDREYNAELNLPTDVPIGHPVRDHQQKVKLSDFVDLMLEAPHDRPCYVHQKSIDQYPGIEDDVRFKEIVGPQTRELGVFMWLGSGGTKSSLHFDFHDNILVQVQGSKRVSLVSPAESRFLYPFPGIIEKSRVDADNPDLERFPKYTRATILEATIGPGEGLYVPRRWWHAVRSLDPSISVNYFYGPRAGVMELAPMVYSGGPVSWLTIVKDFFWHGLLGVKYPKRLYVLQPFGAWYYAQVVGYFRRRLQRLSPIR